MLMEFNIINCINKNLYYILLIKIILTIIIYLSVSSYIFYIIYLYFEKKIDILNNKIKKINKRFKKINKNSFLVKK